MTPLSPSGPSTFSFLALPPSPPPQHLASSFEVASSSRIATSYGQTWRQERLGTAALLLKKEGEGGIKAREVHAMHDLNSGLTGYSRQSMCLEAS